MSMNCVLYAVQLPRAERLRELEDEEEFFQELENCPKMEIGKEWHGLHYLLTGTAAEFRGAEGFLVDGGEEVGPEIGYGPARLFSPREVDDIHSVLVDISPDELWSRFDADEMTADQVYPSLDWHEEPELKRQVYQRTYAELKKFVDEASRRGQCVVVTMG
ncbi:MAG TPA: YfbM family protein [Pirellulales bacterium]|nr:YfbM family protein [Pirellulales bacterium]